MAGNWRDNKLPKVRSRTKSHSPKANNRLRWFGGDAAEQRARMKAEDGDRLWKFTGDSNQAQMAGFETRPVIAVSKKRPRTGMFKNHKNQWVSPWEEV